MKEKQITYAFRVPKELLEEVKSLAKRERMSINGLILKALDEKIEKLKSQS